MTIYVPCPVAYRGTVYPSQRALARAIGRHHSSVYHALRRGAVDSLGGSPGGTPRSCTIDGVEYPSIRSAARALGVNPSAIHRRLKEPRA